MARMQYVRPSTGTPYRMSKANYNKIRNDFNSAIDTARNSSIRINLNKTQIITVNDLAIKCHKLSIIDNTPTLNLFHKALNNMSSVGLKNMENYIAYDLQLGKLLDGNILRNDNAGNIQALTEAQDDNTIKNILYRIGAVSQKFGEPIVDYWDIGCIGYSMDGVKRFSHDWFGKPLGFINREKVGLFYNNNEIHNTDELAVQLNKDHVEVDGRMSWLFKRSMLAAAKLAYLNRGKPFTFNLHLNGLLYKNLRSKGKDNIFTLDMFIENHDIRSASLFIYQLGALEIVDSKGQKAGSEMVPPLELIYTK